MEAIAPAPALAPSKDVDSPGVKTADPLVKTLPGANGESVLHGEGTQKPVSPKKESIDLGLAVAAAVRRPGQCFTVEDLADICACSPQRISQLQARALRNLRRALERSGVDWRRVMHDLQSGQSSEYRVSGLDRRNGAMLD